MAPTSDLSSTFAAVCDVNRIATTEFLEHDGRAILIIRLTDARVTDDDFDQLLERMALFFKLVKRHRVKYHFVIDVHTIENIPYMRLVEIQTYLLSQRARLAMYLHNSVIITQSDAMKKVVDYSMCTVYTPTRPFTCLVAKPPQELHPALKVPQGVVDEVVTFLGEHINTTPLPPERPRAAADAAGGAPPAPTAIDLSTLPRPARS